MNTLVLGLVVVARFIRDAHFVRVLPHCCIITAIAGARVATVNDLLDRQVGRGPGTFAFDVDAIGKGTGRPHRPAGATVCRDRQENQGL